MSMLGNPETIFYFSVLLRIYIPGELLLFLVVYLLSIYTISDVSPKIP